MPQKAIAKRDRRGKGRGKGRGAVNPTRRMAERLGGMGGLKSAQWAWRVVFMSHLRKLSHRSIQALFRAEGKHISKGYVGKCLKDYKKHGNPDHRNEQKAFRLESLAPVQSTWLKDLLLETPDLFYFAFPSWQLKTENLPCIITVTSKILVLPTVKGIGC